MTGSHTLRCGDFGVWLPSAKLFKSLASRFAKSSTSKLAKSSASKRRIHALMVVRDTCKNRLMLLLLQP